MVSYRAYRAYNVKPDTPSSSVLSQIDGQIHELGLSRRFRLVLGDAMGLYLLFHGYKFAERLYRLRRGASFYNIKQFVMATIYRTSLKIPILSSRIAAEIQKSRMELRADLNKSLKNELVGEQKFLEIPDDGIKDSELMTMLTSMAHRDNPKWESGKVSGAVYSNDDEHWSFISDVYKLYCTANPLHPDIWPSVMKFDAEICSMAASLVNGGDKGVCGATTSGGTESILMSIKCHRKWALETKGITEPEIIAPITAHAAFDKACEILNITLHSVPVDPVTQAVHAQDMYQFINSNTIMLVGSAPQFPHGIIDPIEDLSKLAVSYGVGLHVDCCLGGFVLPFARKLGYDIPNFDFALPGVTAMSMDTHKYGYSSKGTSVVLYRSSNLRKYQYFAYPKWPGGLYITPSTAGSRSGAILSSTWAAMLRTGFKGYLEATDNIIKTVLEIKEGIEKIPGLVVVGDPQAMIVAFDATDVNVICIADKMKSLKGWSLNILQRPICVHLCVTKCTAGRAGVFLQDLEEVYDIVKQDPESAEKTGNAPIYGLASSLPSGPVDELLFAYTDCVLEA